MDTPELLKVEQVSDGWVKKYVLTYRMADGSLHIYEEASRKDLDAYQRLLDRNGQGASSGADAVCIVARTPRDTLLMIREFRYALNSWCIAFPAGLIDAGETPLQAARRELAEETGYSILEGTPARILPQAGYSSTGLTDETVQVLFVQAEKTGEPRTETNELIEVFELPLSQVGEFLEANTLPIGTRAQLVLEAFRS